ncbi:hypothetical protein [Nostoc sp. TCL26-01]|uniref:hypothetical protein n=1 Tax=Nostoc sp. TCL26-01 TaxID=2576904 RepID=UPI0015BD6C36|nr:hypothetical protein [Nostoc sp. TCL26-01]
MVNITISDLLHSVETEFTELSDIESARIMGGEFDIYVEGSYNLTDGGYLIGGIRFVF